MFPACAGMIPGRNITVIPGICVPRMRGDDPHSKLYMVTCSKCSPHARG